VSDEEHEEIDRRVQVTSDAADHLIRHNARTNHLSTVVNVIGMLILLGVVSAFGAVNTAQQSAAHNRSLQQQAETLTILHRVLAVTDPNSSYTKTSNAKLSIVIDHLIACLENHDDQVSAIAVGKEPPVTLKGCPADPASSEKAAS